MMKRFLLILALVMAALTATQAQKPRSIVPLADPYILLDGNTYYAYGTHAADGIEYWTSTDLMTWQYGGLALSKSDASEQRWFWAPEVYHIGDRYVMYFSANEHLFAAVGDSPRGPFRQVGGYMLESVLGDEKCIDSSVFRDDDGSFQLFFVRFTDGNCIWTCRLEDDGITPVAGTLRHCLSVSSPWESKMGRVCEGPFVLKHDNLYYLTYSANDYQSPDYGVGFAMARTLRNSWSKYAGNPILQRRDDLVGTGHHSFFTDKDGQLRIVFHAHDSQSAIHPRRMYIGTVSFEGRTMKITDDPILRPCSKDLYIKGNIVAPDTKLTYDGDGRYSGTVTLDDGGELQFVNKHICFAYDNDDEKAFFKNTHINGGTYHFSVDVNAGTWDAEAPVDEHRISAFGSSVCNGQGATDFRGYAYLYGQQLEQRHAQQLSAHPFHVHGIAIGGNTTQSLLNRYADLTHDFSRYVIVGLSMGNEGIHEASDKQAIVNQFTTNLQKIVAQAKADGKVPVVMNNYTRSDFTLDDYAAIKQANLMIHEWDVASVNTLGAIDDGTGKWAAGFIADNGHPNTAGHKEFMYAMPPSLFDALAAGKTAPERDATQSMALSGGASLRFTAEGTLHPFALSLRFRGNEPGQLLSASSESRNFAVSIDDDGHIVGRVNGSEAFRSEQAVDASAWHTLTVSHYYARGRTFIYIDNVEIGNVRGRQLLSDFIVGDTSSAVRRDVSELMFWRAALSPEEVEAVVGGRMLRSSLELYVPLKGPEALDNKAVSMNSLRYVPGQLTAVGEVRAATDALPLYNLLGQRVDSSAQGIVISQHRKMVVRRTP